LNWRQIRIGTGWTQSPVAAAVSRAALDLIIPLTGFDGEAAQSPGLSAEAWRKITFLSDPVCDGCSLPFEYATGLRCAACQARPPAFARARAACLYDEHSRDLILQLKHADRPELGRLFALWLNRAAADLVTDADLVAPVPLHAGRLFRRRYNQAAEIARPLARLNGLAFLPDSLIRRRDTGSQGGKSATGRRRNVAGAFAVRRPDRIAGKRVLLIDDVLTTGATASACARALLDAGAAAVDLAVVARVKEAPSRII
jgi:ComF family protein